MSDLILPQFMTNKVQRQILLEGFVVDKGGYTKDAVEEIIRWYEKYNSIIDKLTNRSSTTVVPLLNNMMRIRDKYIKIDTKYKSDHIANIYIMSEEDVTSGKNEIKEHIDKYGYFLFSSGYKSHATTIYFTKLRDSGYEMYLVNSGEGLEYHPSNEENFDVIIKKTLTDAQFTDIVTQCIIMQSQSNSLDKKAYYYLLFSSIQDGNNIINELKSDVAVLPIQKSGTCTFLSVWYGIFIHCNIIHSVNKATFMDCYNKIKIKLISDSLDEIISKKLYSPYVYNTMKILYSKYDEAEKHVKLLDTTFNYIYRAYIENIKLTEKITLDPSEVFNIDIIKPDYVLGGMNLEYEDKNISVRTLELERRRFLEGDRYRYGEDEEIRDLSIDDINQLTTYLNTELVISLEELIADGLSFTDFITKMRAILLKITEFAEKFMMYCDDVLISKLNETLFNSKLIIVIDMGKMLLKLANVFRTVKYKFMISEHMDLTKKVLLDILTLSKYYSHIYSYIPKTINCTTNRHGSFYIKALHAITFIILISDSRFNESIANTLSSEHEYEHEHEHGHVYRHDHDELNLYPSINDDLSDNLTDWILQKQSINILDNCKLILFNNIKESDLLSIEDKINLECKKYLDYSWKNEFTSDININITTKFITALGLSDVNWIINIADAMEKFTDSVIYKIVNDIIFYCNVNNDLYDMEGITSYKIDSNEHNVNLMTPSFYPLNFNSISNDIKKINITGNSNKSETSISDDDFVYFLSEISNITDIKNITPEKLLKASIFNNTYNDVNYNTSNFNANIASVAIENNHIYTSMTKSYKLDDCYEKFVDNLAASIKVLKNINVYSFILYMVYSGIVLKNTINYNPSEQTIEKIYMIDKYLLDKNLDKYCECGLLIRVFSYLLGFFKDDEMMNDVIEISNTHKYYQNIKIKRNHNQ